jgi:hypothetical protein
VRRVVIMNRWKSSYIYGGSSTGATEGPRIAGAVLTLKNHWGETINSYTLSTAAPFYSIPVSLPGAGVSPSAVPSPALTPSTTPTGSVAPGAEASTTASPSTTATPVASGAAGLAAALRLSSAGGPAPLPLVELWAFTPAGRLVSATAAFSTATSSGPATENAGAAVDLCGDGYVYAGVPACGWYESADTGPASWTVTFAAPSQLSTIWLANRAAAPYNGRLAASRALLEVLDGAGAVLAAWNLTSSASYSTFSLAPGAWPVMPDLSVDFQTSPANQASLVRYITVSGCPSATDCPFLHFRELACFDDVFNNVCAGKTTFNVAQYYNDIGAGGFYYPSSGVNMVLGDLDATYGDLTCSAVGGPSALWGVDLGGVYNIRQVVVFNRGPAANAARLNNSTLRLLNAFNATVGQVTLSNRMVQSYPVTLFPPTATQTPSQTPTPTATPTGSGTGSPSQTAVPTASLSPGAAPSVTPSSSSTGSNTATPSGTPPVTPSPTPSPLSPLASVVRIQLYQPINLNFIEMIVISKTGAVISHPSVGGVATASSVYAANTPPVRGQDLVVDPLGGTNVSILFHTASTPGPSEWWQVAFPPTDVARVIFVNRGDGTNLNQRVVLGQGVITVAAANGTQLGRYVPNGNLVQPYDLAPLPAVAGSPDPADPGQTDTQAQLSKARYLVITVPAGVVYFFREVQLLDANLTVVSHGKSATVADNGAGAATAASGSNGLYTYDVDSLVPSASNDVVVVNATGLATPAEYRLDLGGLYGAADLAGVWLWHHRFRLPPAGVRVELQNFYAQTVFGTAVSTSRGAEWLHIASLGGLVPGSFSASPSQTATNTASSSATRTPSRTPTSSLTATASPTASPSATLSSGASPSVTPSPAPTNPVAARITLGGAQCLNFNELLVFSTSGQLISSNVSGATVALNVPAYSSALNEFQGNDNCFDTSATGVTMAPCALCHGACNASGLSGAPGGVTTYTVTFAPTPEWPGGLPQPVGSVIFVNRMESGSPSNSARITVGRGNVSLLRVDGSEAASAPLSSGSATTLQVANITLPPVPNPDSDPSVTEEDKQLKVRYVRVATTGSNYLHFKVSAKRAAGAARRAAVVAGHPQGCVPSPLLHAPPPTPPAPAFPRLTPRAGADGV